MNGDLRTDATARNRVAPFLVGVFGQFLYGLQPGGLP
jgi:hypothetical protein